MGIALGVSLFAGVQIGGDSLGAGFSAFGEHSLGEIDAVVSNQGAPLFVTNSTLFEEFNGTGPENFLGKLQFGSADLESIDSIAQRLYLSSALLHESTGSSEIGQTIVGMDHDESGFGELLNSKGEILNIANLNPGEVYIGDQMADLLFLSDNPIGQNLTVSSSVSSVAFPPLLNESRTIDIRLTIKIVDVFQDKERGKESYSNYIATSLPWLQSQVATAFLQYRLSNPFDFIMGYGNAPISDIIIRWDDKLSLGDDSEAALDEFKLVFSQVLGIPELTAAYDFSDTRSNLLKGMKELTSGITTILNVFGSIIILAGILVIINIQSMALASREKETGIMRAIGSKRRQIIIANLTESLILGGIGAALGLLGGVLYGNLLVFFMGWSFGFPTGDIPTVVTQYTLVSSFVAGFAISQITGLIPAISASRINVAQVLRGLSAPDDLKFGKKSLYMGIVITVAAIIQVMLLDPNPFIDGKDAFADLAHTEKIFLPIASLILGPALIFSYYRSKKLGITIFAIFILFWANFNIFVIFGWLKTGNGGLLYVLYLIMSLVIGSIILFGMNLALVSSVGQKITSVFVGKRKSPLRGTSLVAFQKMTSKATRSTLTFALFATILTLNIFIGTWSYSFRYGFDQVVVELSSGSDVLIYSDTPIPDNLNFSQELVEKFDSEETRIKFMKEFTITKTIATGYLDLNDPDESWDTQLASISTDSLLGNNNEFDLKFNLADNKTSAVTTNGTVFEQYESDPQDPAFTSEDEVVWRSFLNNETLLNKQNESRPMIITTFIFEADNFNFKQTKFTGDSVYLNLTGGGVQEFVIGSLSSSNPIVDFNGPTEGPPTFNSVWFLNDFWADRVDGLSELSGRSNIFLGKSSESDITSGKIDNLITKIEIWANQETGEFRQANGNVFYGIVGVPVYDIYEVQLEGQYRFFLFLQAFVSLGFVVGILGLMVVAFRSVAERTREIGMLRALGFRRVDVVISVVLELVVMGLIGLFIGFINGSILGYALTDINSGGDASFLIPWPLLAGYAALTVGSAILASVFPALKASRIPPSDALRYTG